MLISFAYAAIALKTLHVLAVVLWIGGMAFAHFFLRPAVAALEPPVRVALMHDVLGRFFAAVLGVVVVVLASGLALIGMAHGAGGHMPWTWTAMTVLGLAMMAIFGHIRFALYKRLRRAVAAKDWPAGGAALAAIRTWVGVNLAIGVAIIVIVGFA
jgi:uncharacterized membrane protein